jgi:hypothetical protein
MDSKMEHSPQNIFNKLLVRTYKVIIKVKKTIHFNYYPGFVLRNALTSAAAELNCHHYQSLKGRISNCSQCSFNPECSYYRFNFQTGSATKPVPFIISTDKIASEREYLPGESIHFNLTLFGSANENLMFWINAIRHIGENRGIGTASGRFELTGFGPEPEEDYQLNEQINSATLTFYRLHFSKTKLSDGKILPFDKLLTLIVNRTNTLNKLYGNCNCLTTRQERSSQIASDEELKPDSPLKYPPGGSHDIYFTYSGEVRYSGRLTEYSDLLHLGSQISIGQFTAAGLGQFRLDYG